MMPANGGKQPQAHDTVIPQSNPDSSKRGKAQKMTTADGQQKGLQQTLEERGFNVKGMRAKSAPVCPAENTDCCMARLLSHQDDVKNQVSMLEDRITKRGHHCVFLPKFHCELNPIEMVRDSADRSVISKAENFTVLGLGQIPVPRRRKKYT
jgi:hypothetical protein